MKLRETTYPKTIASLKADYQTKLREAKRYTDFAKHWKEKLENYETCVAQLEGKMTERDDKQQRMADTSSAEKALQEIEKLREKCQKLISRLDE